MESVSHFVGHCAFMLLSPIEPKTGGRRKEERGGNREATGEGLLRPVEVAVTCMERNAAPSGQEDDH